MSKSLRGLEQGMKAKCLGILFKCRVWELLNGSCLCVSTRDGPIGWGHKLIWKFTDRLLP